MVAYSKYSCNENKRTQRSNLEVRVQATRSKNTYSCQPMSITFNNEMEGCINEGYISENIRLELENFSYFTKLNLCASFDHGDR